MLNIICEILMNFDLREQYDRLRNVMFKVVTVYYHLWRYVPFRTSASVLVCLCTLERSVPVVLFWSSVTLRNHIY